MSRLHPSELRVPACQSKFEPRPETSARHDKRGEIHQVSIWFEMMGQDSVILLVCVERMEIVEREECVTGKAPFFLLRGH